ncbi:hypothetical Protein pso3_01230 [Candidatus Phytoplasma solani]
MRTILELFRNFLRTILKKDFIKFNYFLIKKRFFLIKNGLKTIYFFKNIKKTHFF